jgi:hypothetical protein
MVSTQKSGAHRAKRESMPEKGKLGVADAISSASAELGEITPGFTKKIDRNHQFGSFNISSCQFCIYATLFRLHTASEQYQYQTGLAIINSHCPTLPVGTTTTYLKEPLDSPKEERQAEKTQDWILRGGDKPMTHRIFDKTDKGREEIATRKHQLPNRLRTLLVMVDGKQSDEELLKKVAGLGLTSESMAELLENGFIRLTAQAEPAAAAPTPVESPAPPAAMAVEMPSSPGQFQAIYQFYTETIKSTIGLRGYALQLKVEKAGSIDDFRALRAPYLEAVLKAKGNEVARSLQTRLDQLLYMGESAPNATIVGLSAVMAE